MQITFLLTLSHTSAYQIKRDLYTWKETYVHEKRPTKETYTNKKRPTKETHWVCHTSRLIRSAQLAVQKRLVYMKRDLQKRPTESVTHPDLSGPRNLQFKRDLYTWKETHNHAKKPIHMKRNPQTRPKKQYEWKEAYIHETQPTKVMYKYEKRHVYMKRDLGKRPTDSSAYLSASDPRKLHVKSDVYIWKETCIWKET